MVENGLRKMKNSVVQEKKNSIYFFSSEKCKFSPTFCSYFWSFAFKGVNGFPPISLLFNMDRREVFIRNTD